MLAPPNRGSRVARLLGPLPIFRRFYGPVGVELAQLDGETTGWPAPPRPCGVIAGTRAASVGNPVSWVTRGLGLIGRGEPSDGTVLLEETRLGAGELDDFATVDASHTWILRNQEVLQMVLKFFETGRFR